MDPDQQSSGAKRRRVTILFADLTGFSVMCERIGVEEAYSIFTGCLTLLDGVVRRHGGAVDKYLGDCLMAVFGHPLEVPDAELRAMQAAVEIRQLVHDYRRELRLGGPLDVQIGINTGRVIASDVGERVRREFAVMGDPVNIAARLKDLAERGQIFIGPETAEEARGHFELRPLEPLPLKGKQERVAVHELVRTPETAGAAATSTMRFSRLVGRESELARLEEWVVRVASGRGGVVTLRGEEGMGKSRLLDELRARVPASVDFVEARRFEAALAALEDVPLEKPQALVLDGVQSETREALRSLEGLLQQSGERPLLLFLAFRPGTPGIGDQILELVRERCAGRHLELELGPLEQDHARELLDELAREQDLSPRARELIEERARGRPLEIILSAFLSSALLADDERSEEDASQGRDAERRRATVLFADLSGFTSMSEQMDPAEAHAIFSDCLKLLDDVARRHGGTVDKYLGDCIMAIYGVPVAIEDAPKAAINAAIEMRRRVEEFSRERSPERPLRIHTGIDTGLAIAGDISGPVIHEYALMGDSVNVASRLKDLAPPGEIRVGPETEHATRSAFQFEPLPSIQLKGQGAHVPTYQLLSEEESLYRSRAGSQVISALVGRESELQQLQHAVSGLESRRGGVASVVGEAGIGKSRLLEELRESDEVKKATWLEGRSLSIGSNLSYHPFADLLRAWAGIADGEDEATAEGQLRTGLAELFGEEAEDLVSPLATVLGFLPSLQQRRSPAGMGGDTSEKVIIRAVGLLLRSLADRQPLVVYLDDLHWADTSSVELLAALLGLATRYPILFLLAYRPEVSDSILATLAEGMDEAEITGEEIRLAPLDRGAAERMLWNLFSGGEVPRGLRKLIEERASGNPFYIEQVVLSLIDSGHVAVRDGGLSATDRPDAMVIPATVEELLMSRIDQLPLPARQVLHIASIVGRSSHQRILASVAEDPELESRLDTLRAAQLLTRWERAAEIVWEFKHPLIQEVSYETITQAKRREYHGRTAESIEVIFAEGRPGRNGMLAYHFSHARDLERAEKYLFLAGDEAIGMAASGEALHFFQEASKLYFEMHGDGGDPAKKAILEGNIGQAQLNRGQLPEAVEHYNRALEFLGEHVPQSKLQVQLRLAPILLRVLARLYRPRRRPPEATPQDREVIRLMFARNHAEITMDPIRFIYDGLDTVCHLQRVDPHSVEQAVAIYAGQVGPFAYSGMSFAISQRFLDAALPLVPRDDPGKLLSCRFFNFLHHYLEGGWSEEHCVDEALLEEGLRLGQLWDVVMYLDLDTERRLYRGEFAKVREQIEELAKIADLYQYDFADTSSQAYNIYMLIEQRDLEAALEAADGYFHAYPEGYSPAISLGAKAKVLVMLGDLEGAEKVLERCSRVMEEAGSLLPYHLSAYARSRMMLDLALVEAGADGAVRRRARKSAREAVSLAGKVAGRRPEVFKLAGHLDWARGRRRSALGWWRRALAAGEALGTRPELARIRLEAGMRLAGASGGPASLDGVSAAELLDQGRAELEGLGLPWDPEQQEARP